MLQLGRKRAHVWLGGALAGITLLAARSGSAHLDLLQPSPRVPGLSADPNANLKEGPCGQEQNGRTQNVNVFAPGATITVRWREFVNHRGYYRVAFDESGDDGFPTFPGPGASPEGDDPTRSCPVDGRVILGYELEDGTGGEYSLELTLPDVECEDCTLQVIQYMYDTGRPYYFQCADLALRRAPSDTGAEDAGAADAGAEDARALDAAAAPQFHAAESCSLPLPPRPRRDAGPRPAPAPLPGNEAAADASSPELGAPAARGKKGGGCSLPAQPADHEQPALVAFGALASALWALRSRARSPLSRQRD